MNILYMPHPILLISNTMLPKATLPDCLFLLLLLDAEISPRANPSQRREKNDLINRQRVE
jgi:hypothetical protein